MAELNNNITKASWIALMALNQGKNAMMPKTGLPFIEEMVADVRNTHFARPGSYSINQANIPWEKKKLLADELGMPIEDVLVATGNSTLNQPLTKSERQQIIFINDNKSPVVSLVLQNRPTSIKVEQNTTWSTVKSLGMNNPFQIYTGSEDTISFEISWYSTNVRDRSDVINKCKLLESWTKADGYNSSPPFLKLVWGDSDLFINDLFILSAAPYQLTNFQQAAKHKGEILNLKLLPNLATQQITLKKVALKNQESTDIITLEQLKSTNGIRIY